jgi:hypothetical protein
VIISRRIRWAENVARMETNGNGCRNLIGNLQERELGDLAVDGKVIVKWIFWK